MRPPYLLGELRLQLAQRLGAAQECTAVQFSLGVDRHHVGVHVGGGFVSMNTGVNHIDRPMPVLKEFQTVTEIGVLLLPGLALHVFRAGRHQVLDGQDAIFRTLSGNLALNLASASSRFAAPIWVLSGVRLASAFGVSCSRKACAMDRLTAIPDFSFCVRT